MLPVILTTTQSYRNLLPDFFHLANKYWQEPRQIVVDVSPDRESWTDQMSRVLQQQTCEYFIRFAEDFFLHKQVSVSLGLIETDVLTDKPFRVGLQGPEEGYMNDVTSGSHSWLDLSNKAQYLCSLEASVFHRERLLEALRAAGPMTIQAFETFGSRYASEREWPVGISLDRVFTYKDAMRQGQPRIKKENGVFLVLSPGDVWLPLESA